MKYLIESETGYVDRVTIVGVAFVVIKESGQRPWRYDTKSNPCQNYSIKFVNKNLIVIM